MESGRFSPPKDGCFNVGSIENKTASSADGAVPSNRRARGHRRFNKSRPLKPIAAARASLQRSVAFRSSALRQVKLAKARVGPDSSEFDAVQAAAIKACSAPLITRMMKQIKTSKRPRNVKFSRCLEHETPYAAAAGNTNTTVNNDSGVSCQFTPSFCRQSPVNEVNPSAG